MIILIRAYTLRRREGGGGGTQRQQVSTTFLTRTKTHIFVCVLLTGVRTSGLWVSSPTLCQLSHLVTVTVVLKILTIKLWLVLTSFIKSIDRKSLIQTRRICPGCRGRLLWRSMLTFIRTCLSGSQIEAIAKTKRNKRREKNPG